MLSCLSVLMSMSVRAKKIKKNYGSEVIVTWQKYVMLNPRND